MKPDTGALVPWFGCARLIAPQVGAELRGCRWVGIPFGGGMPEVAHIDAAVVMVNDLHRHIVNLARTIADPAKQRELFRELRRIAFHADEHSLHQRHAEWLESEGLIDPERSPSVKAAASYFISQWLGRSGKSGTSDEFNGRTSQRWNPNGGGSNTRYRSAVRSLVEWHRILRRCEFTVMDAFAFVARCEDTEGHGLYVDPPFPDVGERYKHAMSTSQHVDLAQTLAGFNAMRVVCRFYDHPLIRELYPSDRWTWRRIVGRKQTNEKAEEVLILNGPSRASETKALF